MIRVKVRVRVRVMSSWAGEYTVYGGERRRKEAATELCAAC